MDTRIKILLGGRLPTTNHRREHNG